ncbi:uncharacterized protein N7446_005545 [Penicillium canescens]|uniref:uncharacterized protein n=1 Tax=Penicillium canescens TaxID=5083 RepID=UPI0026DFCB19|nr:uncharacterized protein N7446_005545 [Penicillium canescens]KAJ6061425.1 hypothetical protein N7446_005545 [Penicillium canescens]
MHSLLIAILAIIQAGISQAGTLEVIDHDGQCLMWSNDNYGCTGYSASFGLLDGVDCSELSEVVNGNRHGLNVLKVNVCGTEDGSPAAWIQVNHTGLVTFSNKNGNHVSCMLNSGLKAGSWCIATEELDKMKSSSYSSTSKLPTSTLHTSSPYTSSPSISTPSISTPSTRMLYTTTSEITITSAFWAKT